MDIKEFKARFEPHVTVGVDWGGLVGLALPVQTIEITSMDDLRDLGLPWYLGPSGSSCDVFDAGARRLYVGKAVTLLDGPLEFRRAEIEGRESLVEDGTPLELPAYARSGQPILLDGCRRTLAVLSAARRTTPVQLHAVEGPDDPTLFVDLIVPDQPTAVIFD